MTKTTNMDMQIYLNFALFFLLGFIVCYMSCSVFGRDRIETMQLQSKDAGWTGQGGGGCPFAGGIGCG